MVKRMVALESYTFHVVNFCKPDSLYNYGECIIGNLSIIIIPMNRNAAFDVFGEESSRGQEWLE